MYLSLLAGWVCEPFAIEIEGLDEVQERLVQRMTNVAEQTLAEVPASV